MSARRRVLYVELPHPGPPRRFEPAVYRLPRATIRGVRDKDVRRLTRNLLLSCMRRLFVEASQRM